MSDAKSNRTTQVDKALRSVLEYRIYSDLRRGWRIVSPNLEQSGLLEIEYLSLDEICNDDECWSANVSLLSATPEKRKEISLAFLDFLRSRLAIKAEALDQLKLEEIGRQSRQQLIEPWLIEENESLHFSTVAYPRPRKANDNSKDISITPHSLFGRWLKGRKAFSDATADEMADIIKSLFAALLKGGIIEKSASQKDEDPSYQLLVYALESSPAAKRGSPW